MTPRLQLKTSGIFLAKANSLGWGHLIVDYVEIQIRLSTKKVLLNNPQKHYPTGGQRAF